MSTQTTESGDVRAVCPLCDRIADVSDPEETVERHNQDMHDGGDVAAVVEWTEDGVNAFEKSLRDQYDMLEYEDFIASLAHDSSWRSQREEMAE